MVMYLQKLIQVVINTVGAGYLASMYAGSGVIAHAAAGAVGSMLTEAIGSIFYFGMNDWRSMTVATLTAPVVTGLAIMINDQFGLTTTYIAIGVAQFLYALGSYFNPLA